MPKNIYKLRDGSIVAGVTTIINQLDKPALIQWAWKLGKEGKDWREERDSAGDIGTLVHEAIMNLISNGMANHLDNPIINSCIEKFIAWWTAQKFTNEIPLIEQPLVSEKHQFGGQPDIFIVGRNRLVDVKTSGGIYDSHWLQIAGYDILLREQGYTPKEYQIIWLPKDDRFDCPIRTDLRREKQIFKYLLKIYQLRRDK